MSLIAYRYNEDGSVSESFTLSSLSNIDISMEAELDKSDAEDYISALVSNKPVEFSCETRINPWVMFYLLTGIKPTNNWFKMHGGVMRRKRHSIWKDKKS